ncbi:MAG: hypothetical protein ABL904_10075 [Hyphomicrobiaceae bacterium]
MTAARMMMANPPSGQCEGNLVRFGGVLPGVMVEQPRLSVTIDAESHCSARFCPFYMGISWFNIIHNIPVLGTGVGGEHGAQAEG